jgi:alkanesulfonate monooxygenase SsuD/methylene tetrahydromethanopterin reductase-like flavin-dependent oxidoreductase (luciferase family)
MIRLAARHADIVGLVPRSLPQGGLDPADFAVSAVREKLAVLDAAVTVEQRIDGGPERSALVFGIFDRVGDCPPDGWIPPELVDASPHALIGEPDRVADILLARREQFGITYYVCFDQDIERMEPILARVVDRDSG